MFEEYRKSYDEMESDPTVVELRQTLDQVQEALRTAEASYRERMAEAEEEIKRAVLEQQKSVTLFNVVASFSKGRKSTSWMKVAQELNPPESLVLQHTKIGQPSVSIKVL